MTHPLIDINKPIRLTDFGKKQIDNNINLSDARIDSYPITIDRLAFALNGKLFERDERPSIENYEPIKQESQIDKWHSVPDDSTQAATTRPTEIELSQVEKMAWELKKSGLTIFDAYSVAQKFLDEVKKRRENGN